MGSGYQHRLKNGEARNRLYELHILHGTQRPHRRDARLYSDLKHTPKLTNLIDEHIPNSYFLMKNLGPPQG